ncbi:MAG: ubiquitin-conjugating enzyme E2 [Candidatus Heimdallarchaeota archaeon]|nr:ubiquitin-conjugating enzyme E2 [Candidatus Heimdallarchaeota archaeon]
MQDLHSRRLREEFKRMLKTYPPKTSTIKWQIINNNLHHYKAIIKGKVGTPYENGKWEIKVELPPEYPFRPPIVNFITQIWHPNIAIGRTQWKWGSNVCLSLINWNNIGKVGGWKETITLPSVFEHIEMMLDVYQVTQEGEFPEYLVDPNDPFNPEAGKQMREKFDLYWNNAIEWTQKYAQ